MDKAMKIIAILIPMMIIAGMVLEYLEIEKAHLLTGIGVLGVMFVLIPFFLFWRYDRKRQLKELEAKREEEIIS